MKSLAQHARVLGWASCGALFLALLETAQVATRTALTGGGPPLLDSAWDALRGWLVVALLAPLVFDYARRRPLFPITPRSIAAHALGALVFSAIHLALQALLIGLGARYPVEPGLLLLKTATLYLTRDVLIYGGLVALVEGLRLSREGAERERREAVLQAGLAEARLAALAARLNPHFLFNTLNAVSVLALKGDADGVNRALALLADLLRASLDGEGAGEIALERELALAETYLAIERLRFGDRLLVEFAIDPAARAALVPGMVLQPLLDNAVRHGVGARQGQARIRVSAQVDSPELLLRVSDSGDSAASIAQPGHGIGLQGLRARLEALYPGRHRLLLETGDGATTASLALPLHIGAGAKA